MKIILDCEEIVFDAPLFAAIIFIPYNMGTAEERAVYTIQCIPPGSNYNMIQLIVDEEIFL